MDSIIVVSSLKHLRCACLSALSGRARELISFNELLEKWLLLSLNPSVWESQNHWPQSYPIWLCGRFQVWEQIKRKGIQSQPYPLFWDSPFFLFFTFNQEERGFLPSMGLALSLSLSNSFWFDLMISKSQQWLVLLNCLISTCSHTVNISWIIFWNSQSKLALMLPCPLDTLRRELPRRSFILLQVLGGHRGW